MSLEINYIEKFLSELSTRLEADGFAEDDASLFFVRSIADLARRLQITRLGGGASGNSAGY